MKKLLNISVIAALAVLPMTANAATGDIVAGAPVSITERPEQTAADVTTTVDPKYALAVQATTDSNIATAGYVKGAYNAAIRAINKVSEETANSLTADNTAILTNKTIDANGTGNSIINLETDNFAETALAKSVNGIAAALDTKLVTEKAVATAIDGMVTESGQQTLTNKTISGGTVSNATISGGTIDADSTTINNLETDNFKTGTVVDSKTGIATTNASDSKLVSEGAVRKAINDLTNTYATQTGAAATAAAAVNGATVNLGTLAATNTIGGTANASITVMDTWGSDTAAETPVTAKVDLTNASVSTVFSGAPTITAGTVTYTSGLN